MAGQLIEREKGKYLLRVFVGRDPQTGKRHYHNSTFHGSKTAAEKHLRKLVQDRDTGVLVVRTLTVGELLDDLVQDYRINGKSSEWARMVVDKHLRPVFGKVPTSNLTTDAVRRHILKRQTAGAKNSTINRELALLRRAFRLAMNSTPPKVAAVPRIPTLEERNTRTGFFEDAEYRALMAELPERLRAPVAFAYFTGCRKGEVLGLRWPQVDLGRGVVRLEAGTTKNKEARIIPLVPDLVAMLEMQQSRVLAAFPGCEYVFPGETGEKIKSFRGAWWAACYRAKLWQGDEKTGKPTKLFHDLRRTGVRNLVRSGVPEDVATKISGHKTRSVFTRYNVTSESDLLEAARRLQEHITAKRQQADQHTEQHTESGSWHTIGTLDPDGRVN